jgi:hypothetical protein
VASGDWVTELNAKTGALVKVITGFNIVLVVWSDGTHVWVASQFGNSVTELNAATGRPGEGDQRISLRVQQSVHGPVRRHPRVGGQLW